MGASLYECKKKRILVEAEERGPGWKKRALKQLDKELDLYPVHSGGRVVGKRQRETGAMNCTKRTFYTEEAAQHSIAQTKLMGGMNKKPESYYQCPHCGHWHLTSKLLNKTTAPVSVDVDDDE